MAQEAKAIRLRDVAKAAGVSQGTASNVFSRPELVREEVRERVRAVAKQLGYAGPSPMGRLLRAGKVNAIGIAAAEPLSYFFRDPWMSRLLTEVAAVCDERGAGIALVSVAGGQHLSWGVDTALVDGFLLRRGGRELLSEMMQRRGLPFVALSRDASEPDVPAVGIDDFGGGYAAARHLMDLGHRRVAMLGLVLGDDPGPIAPDQVRSTPSVNVRERARGYWAALAEVGVPESEVPVLAVRSDGMNVGEALALVFRAGHPPPTALLAMSDRVALKAMDWLARQGIRVPGHVSVVGFDDIPQASAARPSLTTVEQPYRRIADRAVAAILDGDMPQGAEVLPVSLVVRDSTGPVPLGDGGG
jgi:DNA-binding LacI/PurR family transcriptional regulator